MNATTTLSITGEDVLALLPLLVLTGVTVVVMLAIAIRRHHALTVWLTVLGLAAATLSLPMIADLAPRNVTPLLMIDRFTLFYSGLMFLATGVVAILCYGYFKDRPGIHEELYLLLLLATIGAVVLVASQHFASFFLGLEILSLSLFALVPYAVDSKSRLPIEAGTKYLILAAVASAFLLFGMALVYTELGTMAFPRMGTLLFADDYLHNPYVLSGLALIIAGLGFKLSVVPFHMWTPDVYQGAPAPVSGFLATVSKGAVFALLLRYFAEAGLYNYESVLLVLGIIAFLSMLVGNLLALMQANVKRLLAYSSIAHMGYLLVALIAGGALAVEAVTYYLVAYFVMSLGAFGVVAALSPPDKGRDRDDMEDYIGLFWRRPLLAGIFTAMLLSLAGIPLTVGFVGKFYVFTAGVEAALWTLLVTLIIGSIIGLYYYLRLIVVMFMPTGGLAGYGSENWMPGNVVLGVLTFILLWLGIFPSALIDVIQGTASQLT